MRLHLVAKFPFYNFFSNSSFNVYFINKKKTKMLNYMKITGGNPRNYFWEGSRALVKYWQYRRSTFETVQREKWEVWKNCENRVRFFTPKKRRGICTDSRANPCESVWHNLITPKRFLFFSRFPVSQRSPNFFESKAIIRETSIVPIGLA